MRSIGKVDIQNVRTKKRFKYDIEIIGHNLTLTGLHNGEPVVLTYFQDNEYDISKLKKEAEVLAERQNEITGIIKKSRGWEVI